MGGVRILLKRVLPLLTGILFFLGASSQVVLAQEEPGSDKFCVECHQEQYWIFDTGKWYCLNETSAGCTDCHAGQTDTNMKEQAHTGLVAHPTENDAVICQKCHPDEYAARVEKFAAVAGIQPTSQSFATATPSSPASLSSSGDQPRSLLRRVPPGPWQTASLSFLGISFLAVFLLGCRCWRSEHLQNTA